MSDLPTRITIDYVRNWRDAIHEGYTTFRADRHGVCVTRVAGRRSKGDVGYFSLPEKYLYTSQLLGL